MGVVCQVKYRGPCIKAWVPFWSRLSRPKDGWSETPVDEPLWTIGVGRRL